MSGYAAIKQRMQEPPPAQTPTDRCHASNCPCRGSISFDGRWLCAAHAFAVSDLWPRITEKLRNHDWLIAFTDDIQRMERLHEDWRGFAVQFWANQDEYCMPDPKEGCVPYQLRMRAELQYRCGLGKRPAVRLPKPITVRGNAAAAIAA